MRSHGLRQHLIIIFATTIYTKNLRFEPGKTCGKRYRLELLPPTQDAIEVTTRMTFQPFLGLGNPNLNLHLWRASIRLVVVDDRWYRCIRWRYLYSLGWGFCVPRSLWNVSGFLHYRWWWYVRSRYIILSILHFVWCYIRPWQHLSKLTTQLTLVPPLSLCLRGVFIFGLLTLHFHIFHLIQVKADNKETHAHQAMEKIWTKLK